MSEIDINAPVTTDWSKYDDFLKDADKDNRIGDHDALVVSVTDDQWPSGDPRRKILFNLTTANNAKADLTISPPPSPETLAAEGATYEAGKKRAIATTINLYKQLGQHYGKSPQQIKEGDTFKVKTAKTRIDADGKGGFIRVIAFLDKAHATGGATAAAATAAEF